MHWSMAIIYNRAWGEYIRAKYRICCAFSRWKGIPAHHRGIQVRLELVGGWRWVGCPEHSWLLWWPGLLPAPWCRPWGCIHTTASAESQKEFTGDDLKQCHVQTLSYLLVWAPWLTLPFGLLTLAGYKKIPPYTKVRWTSATIDPTYRLPYGAEPS